MRNTKTQRKPGPISGPWATVGLSPRITAGLLAIGITLISLLLSGCPNPAQQNEPPQIARQTGTLVLAVQGMGAERTIRPENKQPEDFDGIRLRFTDPAAAADYFIRDWQDNGAGIPVYAGTWNLQVTTYIGTVGVDLAASSILYTDIVVEPGGTVTHSVRLLPTRAGTGQGTFEWDIGLPAATTMASMTIEPLGSTPGDTITRYFVGGTPLIDSDYSMVLNVGQYWVTITVTYREQTATLWAILHVYQNMTSRFEETFTQANFPLLLLYYILGRWDGSEWNLDGIDHGHFAKLATAGQVLGVTPDNFAEVLARFNAFAGATPETLTPDGLRALVDAALLYIAAPTIEAGDHANRGEARTAIAAAAANQTTPALAWNAAGTSVTVTLGVYSLTIEFADSLYMVWTVSVYPATGQTTALDIEFCCPPDLEADDITITEGTGAVTTGTLTGTGDTRRLAVTTTRWGDVAVAIDGTDQTARVVGRAITAEEIGGEQGGSMIVGGLMHTVAIRQDGTLWAWGNNASGPLGDGTRAQRTTPVRVGSESQQADPNWIWAYVSTTNIHSMGIRQDDTLWAWGANTNGRLGDGTTTQRDAPVQIQAGTTWAHVAAGSSHTVGIRTDGTLWAWGLQTDGRLGNGQTVAGNVLSPIQIQEGTRWIYATAGLQHTVGIREDGTLWAWGANVDGQLGIGLDTEPQATPIRVGTTQEDLDRRWASVSASGRANRTMGIQDDGTLWGWGSNMNGQIGDGTTAARNTPVPVGLTEQQTWTWATVSAGTTHTVGVRQDGTLWAWGNGANGRLGDGTTFTRHTPSQVGTAAQRADPNWLWTSAGACETHSAGIRTDGNVWAWGLNSGGKTGLGLTAGSTISPTPVDWTPITGTAAITGAPWVGQTLTADTAGINANTGTQGTALLIQWQRGNAAGTAFTNIAGATGATYQLQPADLGFPIRVAVSRTGYVFQIFSPATAPIAPPVGEGNFTITMPDFADGAPPEINIADISILDTGPGGLNQTIYAAGFASVDWFFAHPVTGVGQRVTGPSLDLAEVHGGRLGDFRISVEVQTGGNWYSRIITFRVVP